MCLPIQHRCKPRVGEKFRVKWTGVSRDLPHTGEAIQETALTLSAEEKWPWRNRKKGWLRLRSLGQMGSEEKRLCPTRCSGAASEVGGDTLRLNGGWHLSPHSSLSPDGQRRLLTPHSHATATEPHQPDSHWS